jgi:predicted DNA-binding transcriptional regulator AlpA
MEQTATPKSPTTKSTALVRQPWAYLGLSKAGWYRMTSTGAGPKPVYLPGNARPFYRASDLDRWVAGLKPGRRRRKSTTPTEGEAEAEEGGSAA